MIRLENVNKYFFRHRRNQIHVIDNTSLEMGSTGLVALLGASGSGKTTLLNVIGGLDKISSGRIFINGQRITKRSVRKIDKIRALNIGYIFQNYNLIENMTVFDNVALALKMTGVTGKKEIEDKVNYVLGKVGLYEYRNRYADMLSGGERQRVAIARAIVKNPAVIIADEPTGNLDSKNTLEVMNIIRSIAEERLVILVTHEEELAHFYGTRIIRLRDGAVISDEGNEKDRSLDYRIENQIYLQDIEDHSRLKTDNFDINFYNDSGEKLKLDIVLKKGNIYIRTEENKRIEVVDDTSGIELIDAHYRRMDKAELEAKAIDLSRLETEAKRKYKSVINPFTMISKGFKTLSGYSTMKKVLLLGFFLSAMFITYGVSSVFGVLNITDDEFVGADKSYISVVSKNMSIDTYRGYESNENFLYVMPGDSKVNMEVKFDELIQFKDSLVYLNGSLSDSNSLSDADLIEGRLPENENEIVVDRMALKQTIDNYDTASMGAVTASDFIGRRAAVNNMNEFEIVGITDMQAPCIYADRDSFINMIAGSYPLEDESIVEDDSEVSLIDYTLRQERVKLSKGSWPTNNYEVIVSDSHKDEKKFKIGKSVNFKVNGQKLKIVGYYSDPYDGDEYLTNNEMIKYYLIKKLNNVTICPIDKEQALEQLHEDGVNARDTYEQNRDAYIQSQLDSMKSTVIMAGIILMISFIEMYLMIRASFLSRIREVGVYRAIGVKKKDIRRMFAGEIVAITTIASMPGFALMAFCLWKLSKISFFTNSFIVTPMVIAVCIIVIYGLNLVFGLLPVNRTIKKTPASILARTDI